MRIGLISKKTGLSTDAIRFYEKSGLIKKPMRSEGGYREYSLDTVAAIEFIAHCRSLDIPLTEIKKLLSVRSGSAKSCREANLVIADQLKKLRIRIVELKKLEKSLAGIQAVCNSEADPKDCAIIQSIEKIRKP